jgi:hypothetical protein
MSFLNKICLGLAVLLTQSALFVSQAATNTADALVTLAAESFVESNYPAALRAYGLALSEPSLSPAQAAMIRLGRAEVMLAQRDYNHAKAEYATVVALANAPRHLRFEAEQRTLEIERIQSDRRRSSAAPRAALPPLPKPAVTLFVASNGSDLNAGTRQRPFATLERARDEIRRRQEQGTALRGGFEVVVRGGIYKIWQPFTLGVDDSGKASAPIIYRAAKGERPVFSGGVTLHNFEVVSDPTILERLPAGSRNKVRQIDLRGSGITNVWPLVLGGFASGRGFKSHPLMQLYFNGEPLPLARGPNSGFVQIADVSEPEKERMNGFVGSKTGKFIYEGDLPTRWKGEPELLLYGYWFFGWADSYERVSKIDPAKKEITLSPPYHNYGYRKGQIFYAVNALAELDLPGEWCLDSQKSRIYFLPSSDPSKAVVEIATADFPLVHFAEVSHVRLEGLTWELGCADGLLVRGGANCLLAGCTIRCLGGNGIDIAGGNDHGVRSCDIHSLGRGGVCISGGSRKTLSPGRHFVENCRIYDLSRVDHTYTPGVLCSGVGQRIAHNWIHDVPSSALRVGGNDNVIEYNEINRVVLESDDQGGVDMWGDPTLLGNTYRFNYFHHIGKWREPEQAPECGQAGIRLDDAISGVVIYRNVFFRCGAGRLGFGAIQIHGGKDNIVDANLFANCHWAVSFSPWPEPRWREFIQPFVNSMEIDRMLYARRYPEMDRLDRDINANWLWRNEVLDCDQFLHRNRGGARLFANLLKPGRSEFKNPAAGDFTRQGPRGKTDFFQDVGLYADSFRKDVPREAINKMRAEAK